jgi:hypothetical protein
VTEIRDDSGLFRILEQQRATASGMLHRRECPTCGTRAQLAPFRFPGGVYGLRCEICGQAFVVAASAGRRHEAWGPLVKRTRSSM